MRCGDTLGCGRRKGWAKRAHASGASAGKQWRAHCLLTAQSPHCRRYEQWLRAGKQGLPRPAYVTAIRIFKEELLSKRVVEKAAQLVADLDLTCPSKLFTASTLLSALARPATLSVRRSRRKYYLNLESGTAMPV